MERWNVYYLESVVVGSFDRLESLFLSKNPFYLCLCVCWMIQLGCVNQSIWCMHFNEILMSLNPIRLHSFRWRYQNECSFYYLMHWIPPKCSWPTNGLEPIWYWFTIDSISNAQPYHTVQFINELAKITWQSIFILSDVRHFHSVGKMSAKRIDNRRNICGHCTFYGNKHIEFNSIQNWNLLMNIIRTNLSVISSGIFGFAWEFMLVKCILYIKLILSIVPHPNGAHKLRIIRNLHKSSSKLFHRFYSISLILSLSLSPVETLHHGYGFHLVDCVYVFHVRSIIFRCMYKSKILSVQPKYLAFFFLICELKIVCCLLFCHSFTSISIVSTFKTYQLVHHVFYF